MFQAFSQPTSPLRGPRNPRGPTPRRRSRRTSRCRCRPRPRGRLSRRASGCRRPPSAATRPTSTTTCRRSSKHCACATRRCTRSRSSCVVKIFGRTFARSTISTPITDGKMSAVAGFSLSAQSAARQSAWMAVNRATAPRPRELGSRRTSPPCGREQEPSLGFTPAAANPAHVFVVCFVLLRAS